MTRADHIEDIYRLTELQEAMLLHHLHPGRVDTGVLALRGSFRGPLDFDLFEQAWRDTLACHATLRGSIHHEDLKHPVLVVARDATFKVDFEDWTGIPSLEHGARFARVEQGNLDRGLDLGTPPVMRFTLIRCAANLHRFSWICHHLLLDGWSTALVWNEVLTRYEAFVCGQPPGFSEAPPFRDWVRWARSEETPDAAAFWRENPLRWSPLVSSEPRVAEVSRRPLEMRQSVSVSIQEFQKWAGAYGITPAAACAGVWALVLAEATGSPEPVFGMTFSGRGADFDGVESIVGTFSNTVPLFAELRSEDSLDAFLRRVSERLRLVGRYERRALSRLLLAGGVSLRRPLFDTVLTIANFPVREASEQDSIVVEQFESGVTTSVPLTVAVVHAPELALRAFYEPQALDAQRVEGLLARFAALLDTFVRSSHVSLQKVVALRQPRAQPERERSPSSSTSGETTSKDASSGVEHQLIRIWIALLELPDVGLDQSFFELGGDSILLPKLIDRIRQDFGVELPLGKIFEASTIRSLANVIRDGRGDADWRSVVSIRGAGDRPALYLMHTLEGEIGRYYDLANRVDARRPVFGVQASATPFTDIESMAQHYLSEIREIDPKGPYHFGGFCIGGMIAFEMARQVTGAGGQVATLLLLDSLAPGATFTGSVPVLPSAGRIRRILSTEPHRLVDHVKQRALRSFRRLGRVVQSREAGLELDHIRDLRGMPAVYFEPSMRHFRAARDYAPSPFEGDAVLLRTEDERFVRDLGWSERIRGALRIDFVPGHHSDAFREPHVQELGRKISEILDASDASGVV